MVTTYYAISKDKVITMGIEALFHGSPQALIEKGLEALKQGIRYEEPFDVEELLSNEDYFEIGRVSATKEGPKFQLTTPEEKLQEAMNGNYFFVDGYDKYYNRHQFVGFLEGLGYKNDVFKKVKPNKEE